MKTLGTPPELKRGVTMATHEAVNSAVPLRSRSFYNLRVKVPARAPVSLTRTDWRRVASQDNLDGSRTTVTSVYTSSPHGSHPKWHTLSKWPSHAQEHASSVLTVRLCHRACREQGVIASARANRVRSCTKRRGAKLVPSASSVTCAGLTPGSSGRRRSSRHVCRSMRGLCHPCHILLSFSFSFSMPSPSCDCRGSWIEPGWWWWERKAICSVLGVRRRCDGPAVTMALLGTNALPHLSDIAASTWLTSLSHLIPLPGIFTSIGFSIFMRLQSGSSPHFPGYHCEAHLWASIFPRVGGSISCVSLLSLALLFLHRLSLAFLCYWWRLT